MCEGEELSYGRQLEQFTGNTQEVYLSLALKSSLGDPTNIVGSNVLQSVLDRREGRFIRG